MEDYDDDRYSWYIQTNKECKKLLKEIERNCANENGCKVNGKIYNEYNMRDCVFTILEDNDIEVEELIFETIMVQG